MPIVFKEKGSSVDSKHFIKLKDNDSVLVLLAGQPNEFKQHWQNKQPTKCIGDGCQLCKAGNKPTFRFHINVILAESTGPVVKILEQGWTVYQNLQGLSEDVDLEKTWIKITRKGSGQNDTNYIIIPKGPVTEAQLKMISQLKLFDLLHLENSAVSEAPHSAETIDEVPF